MGRKATFFKRKNENSHVCTVAIGGTVEKFLSISSGLTLRKPEAYSLARATVYNRTDVKIFYMQFRRFNKKKLCVCRRNKDL